MADPDHLYNPDDWEYTCDWSDRDILLEDIDNAPGTVKRFATLLNGPDKFAAMVPIAWDEDGDPEDSEWQWFDTAADALAAVAKAKP